MRLLPCFYSRAAHTARPRTPRRAWSSARASAAQRVRGMSEGGAVSATPLRLQPSPTRRSSRLASSRNPNPFACPFTPSPLPHSATTKRTHPMAPSSILSSPRPPRLCGSILSFVQIRGTIRITKRTHTPSHARASMLQMLHNVTLPRAHLPRSIRCNPRHPNRLPRVAPRRHRPTAHPLPIYPRPSAFIRGSILSFFVPSWKLRNEPTFAQPRSPSIRSPFFPTRSSTAFIVKRFGSRRPFTSPHSSGVETVAVGVARTTYGGTA